jgi:hypothetical protein
MITAFHRTPSIVALIDPRGPEFGAGVEGLGVAGVLVDPPQAVIASPATSDNTRRRLWLNPSVYCNMPVRLYFPSRRSKERRIEMVVLFVLQCASSRNTSTI